MIHRTDVCFGDARLALCRIISRISPLSSESKSFGAGIHRHSYYELHLITSGSTTLSVCQSMEDEENETLTPLPVQRGEMLIIPPGRGHQPFVGENGCRETVFSLMPEKIHGDTGYFAYFTGALDAASCRPLPLSRGLCDNLVAFSRGFDRTTIRDLCHRKTAAYDIVTALFDQIDGFGSQESSVSPTLSEQEPTLALDAMITSRLTIAEIAQNLGYTTRHTARIIRQRYGKSLREIRYENMLATAKHILRSSSECSLASAARLAGFPDTASMRSTFLRMEGITPTEYRARANPSDSTPAPPTEERNPK